MEVTRITQKLREQNIDLDPLSTALWCDTVPVAHKKNNNNNNDLFSFQSMLSPQVSLLLQRLDAFPPLLLSSVQPSLPFLL